MATICWTDPAANPVEISESLIPVLVNDIDLRIINTRNNTIYYPWRLNKSWSNIYTQRGDNDVDPIEQVVYYDPLTGVAPAGNYKIRINHKGALTGSYQNFSLIISGGISDYSYTLDAEKFEIDKVVLFPNPTSDFLNISNLNYDKIEIFDITGKQLSFDVISNNEFIKIDLQNLESGTYFIRLQFGSIAEFLKFIKI